MADPSSNRQIPDSQDPTSDYKKYPKGPNFGMVVALACVAFLLILAAAVLLVKMKGTKLEPHPATPTPNSMVLRPAPGRPMPDLNA